MDISYFFSSPDGDVPVDDATLERPFIVTPLENHPFMTLGDYFDIVRGFVLLDNGKHLVHLLVHLWDKDVDLSDITMLIIRYEKYGTLCQILSVEVFSGERKVKLAVNTAISDAAKETLHDEFDLVQNLYYQTGLPYLPRAYYREKINLIKGELSETILMTLSEWFEDYHEWHFSQDERNTEHITIWDMGGGYRSASDHESREIIRQAAKILTLYYDSETFYRIYPWHHSAGDFVVKMIDGVTDVRLITVRGYEPIVPLISQEKFEAPKALLLFLIELTIKMRLDRLEGIGEPYLAGAHVLSAVLEGFIDALKIKESENKNPDLNTEIFLHFLKSINREEIETLLSLLTDQYRVIDPSDYEAIQKHIKDHAVDFYNLIQTFSY